MMHNIRNGAKRWQIPVFLSDGNSVACSISYHLQICQNNKKPSFDLENESQGQGSEEQNLHSSIGNVRFYISEFFSEIWLPGNIHLCKLDTHTHIYTYTHTARDSSDDYSQNLQN